MKLVLVLFFHGIPWNSMELQGKLVPWKIFQRIPWNSMEFHGKYSIEFHGTPWNSMENIPSNSMELRGIPCRYFTRGPCRFRRGLTQRPLFVCSCVVGEWAVRDVCKWVPFLPQSLLSISKKGCLLLHFLNTDYWNTVQ